MNTHVDDDTLTKVVVVWDGFEMLHSSELAVRGRSVLVLAAQFGQRPVKQDQVTSQRCWLRCKSLTHPPVNALMSQINPFHTLNRNPTYWQPLLMSIAFTSADTARNVVFGLDFVNVQLQNEANPFIPVFSRQSRFYGFGTSNIPDPS